MSTETNREYKAVELEDDTAVLTPDSIIWVYDDTKVEWIKVGTIVTTDGCDCE